MRDPWWEWGAQITVRIEGDQVIVGNGLDILFTWRHERG